MFTGIIETLGRISALKKTGGSFSLNVTPRDPFESLNLGESISINGACLTVNSIKEGSFQVIASPETLSKTTLGELERNKEVNLERAMSAGSRFGGHIVLGHVDGTGKIIGKKPEGDTFRLKVKASPDLLRFIAPKGSVAIDGISLTVNNVETDSFDFVIIPFTASHTTIGSKHIGSNVNIETDVLARYVARLLEAASPNPSSDTGKKKGIDEEFLKEHGIIK